MSKEVMKQIEDCKDEKDLPYLFRIYNFHPNLSDESLEIVKQKIYQCGYKEK